MQVGIRPAVGDVGVERPRSTVVVDVVQLLNDDALRFSRRPQSRLPLSVGAHRAGEQDPGGQ